MTGRTNLPHKLTKKNGWQGLKNSPPSPSHNHRSWLSGSQKAKLEHLVSQFSDVFSETPGRTTVINHEICRPPEVVVRQHAYRIPEARRPAIEEEVKEMLELGIVEPSHSPWPSPIMMVPKHDNTLRFCNDFRKLNNLSTFDG